MPHIVCSRIIKKIKTKILRIWIRIFWRFRCREQVIYFYFCSFYFFYSTTLLWHGMALNACYDNPQEFCLDCILLKISHKRSRDFFTPKFILWLIIPSNLLTHVFDRMQIEMKSNFQIFFYHQKIKQLLDNKCHKISKISIISA